MRHTFYITIVSLLFSVSALTQSDMDNAPRSLSGLKISPIQFGKSYFEMSLELDIVKGKSSIQISPMVLLKKENREEFAGIQGELQYRSYLKRIHRNRDPELITVFSDIDFYAGAYALALNFSRDYLVSTYDPQRMEEIMEDHTMDIMAAEAGVFVGVKFTFAHRITLDLLAGGGVRYSDIDDSWEQSPNFNYAYYPEDDVFDLGYYGVKPRLNLQLGITL